MGGIASQIRFRILTLLNLEKRLSRESYLGTYNGSISRFEEHLTSLGFKKNPLAWIKFNRHGKTSASWARRKSLFAHKQIHVSLMESSVTPPQTRIYVHREDSWVRHPETHYTRKRPLHAR